MEINEHISVVTVFDADKKWILPEKIKWRQRTYLIRETNLHYTKMFGSVLHHLFSVTDGNTAFHLSLNSQTLSWTLLEISD